MVKTSTGSRLPKSRDVPPGKYPWNFADHVDAVDAAVMIRINGKNTASYPQYMALE